LNIKGRKERRETDRGRELEKAQNYERLMEAAMKKKGNTSKAGEISLS